MRFLHHTQLVAKIVTAKTTSVPIQYAYVHTDNIRWKKEVLHVVYLGTYIDMYIKLGTTKLEWNFLISEKTFQFSYWDDFWIWIEIK